MKIIDTYLQKEADPYDSSTYDIFKSDRKNADGDYYWLILSKETAEAAENTRKENFIYRTMDINKTSYYTTPAKWKIYLFNISSQRVLIVGNQYLRNIERNVNYNSPAKTGKITSRMTVNGKSSGINLFDITECGRAMGLSSQKIDKIVTEVKEAVGCFEKLADEVGIRYETINAISDVIKENMI